MPSQFQGDIASFKRGYTMIDCRSEVGITDSIITISHVLANRDLKHVAVIESLKDLEDDETIKYLLREGKSHNDSTNL